MWQPISGVDAQFLADLNQIQTSSNQAQLELSSGLRVQQPSDSPGDVGNIFQLKSQIANSQQSITQLGNVQADLNTADSVLQQGSQLLQQAAQYAVQGANSTATSDQRQTLATQVGAILQQLVSISQTNVAGRYIFSGDYDTQPAYQLDPNSPTGVDRLVASRNTRQIEDVNGVPLNVSLTAQDIFDHRNPDDTPAPDNVFAAVQSLQVALQNNDQQGITNASAALQQAQNYYGLQLSFYGAAEQQVTGAINLAQTLNTQYTAALSSVQDANATQAALQSTEASTELQTAMQARAKMPTTSVFSYM